MYKTYPWQEKEWHYLTARKRNNSLPHALLFTGSEGLGKREFALAFASFLLCKNPSTYACGECSACRLIAAGNHPDLIFIQPESQDKVIGVDDVRDLIDVLSQTSQQGGLEVAIINYAENMNIAASNALLKTLEEPLGNVVIILLSSHPASLPATIRSRCQTIIFSVTDKMRAKDWLREHTHRDISEADLDLLLALANSAPLKALNFSKENKLQERKSLIQNLFALLTGKFDAINMAGKYADYDLDFILLNIVFCLNDILKLQNNADVGYIVNQEYISDLFILKNKLTAEKILHYLDKIQDVLQKNNAGFNLNKQLLLEDIFYVG